MADKIDYADSDEQAGEQLDLQGLFFAPADEQQPDDGPGTVSMRGQPEETPEENDGRREPRRLKQKRGGSAAKNLQSPKDESTLAPMLRQYLQTKREYPEHLLLFQVGDFYEIFFDDARTAAQHLNIRLTSRDKESPDPIPMCGVPIHALDNYLPRLLKDGFSCVIVSQAEDAKDKKGMVRREISRIVTPGVRYEGDGLDEKQFNYLAAACAGSEGGAIAWVDVSTGHLRVQETEGAEDLRETLERIRPAEVLLPSLVFSLALDRNEPWFKDARQSAQGIGCRTVLRPFDRALKSELRQVLERLLPAAVRQDGDSGEELGRLGPLALTVLKTLLGYVEEVSFGSTPNLAQFSIVQPAQSVFIDSATRRNLELTETRLGGERKNSLLYHIDYTRTPMGSRLLADWILMPSGSRPEIEERYDAVEELLAAPGVLEELRGLLAGVRDIDRILSRVTGGRATPRDLTALQDSLAALPAMKNQCGRFITPLLSRLAAQFDSLADIEERLRLSLAPEAPARITEGGIFREGFHQEIDRLRGVRTDGHHRLVELEEKERRRTGISALKVRYNNVFGYFIEVTKNHLHKVPADYERRQTLVNAERFVTKELKDYELNMLSARARLFELERELFIELRAWTAGYAARIQGTSRLLALLDTICALAHLAAAHNYARPRLSENGRLEICEGRHPVVERVIGAHNFVSNNTTLDRGVRRFAVLTGPNMGGKSTYLRQIGLIQLLAQAGSFVPAKSAELPLVDRIFTRIGAADDLTRGDSTFMVEMKEAAAIVRKATSHSLVLIDEVGRGTATLDGLAIATAISEWLHDATSCLTVFATHFHELTRLTETKSASFCLSVGVIERGGEIVFTHRIEERAADRSYGIEVARLAGLPERLLGRAQLLLEHFEKESRDGVYEDLPQGAAVEKAASTPDAASPLQPVCDRLRSCSPNMMTPLQALQEIIELKQLIEH